MNIQETIDNIYSEINKIIDYLQDTNIDINTRWEDSKYCDIIGTCDENEDIIDMCEFKSIDFDGLNLEYLDWSTIHQVYEHIMNKFEKKLKINNDILHEVGVKSKSEYENNVKELLLSFGYFEITIC